MRYVTKTNVITMNGKMWWINARKSGVYSAMLRKMIGQLEAVLSHHSKVNVIRFDLKQSEYTDKNTQITTFNRRLFKWLKRNYKLKRIGFIWCREQETAKHQHYHYVLIIDGHKVQKAGLIANKVKTIWNEISGSYWLPKNCYYNLKRNDYKETQNAIFRISYLAKARGKGYRPPQTKDYGTSRIKPKIPTQKMKTQLII